MKSDEKQLTAAVVLSSIPHKGQHHLLNSKLRQDCNLFSGQKQYAPMRTELIR